MLQENLIDTIISRVLWMPLPTLTELSAELIKNRRENERYPVDSRGMLYGSALESEQAVKVVNVSRSGVGIEAPVPLRVGSMVNLVLDRTVISGQIRWCRMTDTADFAAGILAKRVGNIPPE